MIYLKKLVHVELVFYYSVSFGEKNNLYMKEEDNGKIIILCVMFMREYKIV